MPEFHNAAGGTQWSKALLPCTLDATSARWIQDMNWELQVHHPCGKKLGGSKRGRNTCHLAKDEKSSMLRIFHCVFKASFKRYLTCEELLSPGEKCFKWQQRFSDTIFITCVTQDKHFKHWCGVFPQKVLLKEVPPCITWRSWRLNATSQEYFSFAEY